VAYRSMIACRNSGYEFNDQFVEVNKKIELSKGGKRAVTDHTLSRYAFI